MIIDHAENASRLERERRADAAALLVANVREIATTAKPRVVPDASVVIKELKRLRGFHANAKMKALPVDVDLLDAVVTLLETVK